jgi:EAL domain-containing protein (putative c-di-GMP-specific phosphodiesterase class I)
VFIDDFGKGETSLSLLRSLPVSAIKLDRSLIPSDEDGEGWQFLAGVVAMLQSWQHSSRPAGRLSKSPISGTATTTTSLQTLDQSQSWEAPDTSPQRKSTCSML